MLRPLRALIAVFVALSVLVFVHTASAQNKTAELAKQLKSDDFRVRTQAALALGSTGDEAAIKPLCDAIADENASVKTAVAAALGKLTKPASLKCLEAAIAKETVPAIKTTMQKSIDTIKAQSTTAAAPPPPGKDAKFYVAIEVTNKTSRPAAEVEALVRAAMQAKLLGKTGYAVAPKGETVAQGGQVVKSKKLKGFILMATVEAPVYANGSLAVKFSVAMATYPEKAIQASFSPKLTQTNTPSADTKSEDALFKLCAESAVESFVKVATSL
ncbi:MAG: HEAT repeat domain-containing protein [Polyangiaceae bacterium]|nr:HEAT repeat domain-containing protein [Polyangiaceae bacterium]